LIIKGAVHSAVLGIVNYSGNEVAPNQGRKGMSDTEHINTCGTTMIYYHSQPLPTYSYRCFRIGHQIWNIFHLQCTLAQQLSWKKAEIRQIL